VTFEILTLIVLACNGSMKSLELHDLQQKLCIGKKAECYQSNKTPQKFLENCLLEKVREPKQVE
jgi:hypothetical protein